MTTLTSTRAYRADGLLTAQTFGNGLAETRTYDLQGRLTTQGLGAADARTYRYDANGNLLTKSAPTESGSYPYEALDRLTQDRLTGGTGGTTAFTYDPNGNRLADSTQSYAYGARSNRLQAIVASAIFILVVQLLGFTFCPGLAKDMDFLS